jgi:hypothetical protein
MPVLEIFAVQLDLSWVLLLVLVRELAQMLPVLVQAHFRRRKMKDFLRSRATPLFSPGNRHRLVLLDPDAIDNVCGGIIGQGPSFCLKHGCTKTHQGAQAPILANHFYICRDNKMTAAFMDPCVSKFKLEQDLIDSFDNYQTVFPFDKWIVKFSILNNATYPMSLAELDSEECALVQAKAQRTPKVSKFKSTKEDAPLSLTLTPYKPSYLNQPIAVDDIDAVPQNIGTIFMGIEQGLVSTSTSLATVAALVEDTSSNTFKDLASVGNRVDQMESTLGKRPYELNNIFNAPTIWGSFGILATHILSLSESVEILNAQIINNNESCAITENYVSSTVKSLENSTKQLRTFCISAAGKVNAKANSALNGVAELVHEV